MEKKNNIIKYLIILFMVVCVGAGIVIGGDELYSVKAQKNKNNSKTIIDTKTYKSEVSKVAQEIIPSVVGIISTKVERNLDSKKVIEGIGSGIIIDKAGYILTNNHVAGMNTKDLKVSLFDGREVNGITIWSDPSLDLAIVKIEQDNLAIAPLGDSVKVSIGETAIAIGNPLGLKFQRTVTAGIISAVDRSIQMEQGNFMEDLIQTDASINPGNSGGPLINIEGEVIGINTVKVTSAEGIGFAVPVNIIKPILKSIKEKGRFVTPIMGIVGLDTQMAGYAKKTFAKGIYIYNITSEGGAYRAGLREGDIILTIDNKDVNTVLQMREILYNVGIGNKVKVKALTPKGSKEYMVILEKGRH